MNVAKIHVRFGVGVGILAFALTGCKSGPELHVSVAAPAVLPVGWSTAQTSDSSVSVGVPGGWRVGVDTGANSLADMTSDLGSPNNGTQGGDNSAFGQEMQKMAADMDAKNKQEEADGLAALTKKGVVLNVINGSKPIPGEKRTRFYVKVKHQGGSLSRDDAINIEREHYAFKPKMFEVTLPIGKAVKCIADNEMRDGGSLHQISYVIVDGGDIYSLRFVTEEGVETINSIADQVANSLRIKPTK